MVWTQHKQKILRRGGKKTQKNYTRKILMTRITMGWCGDSGHLEPEILECEVKWTLGNITTNKANGGDGIPAELFQILKDDAVKVLHSICQQIWKTQQWPQDWKKSAFIPIPFFENVQTNIQLHSFHMLTSLCSKSFKQYMKQGLPDVQAGLQRGRGTRDKIANIQRIMEKATKFQKKYLPLLH